MISKLIVYFDNAGNMAYRRKDNMAIPLCLPNNCQWNAATGEYIKAEETRSSLYVVDEALQKLRTVRGKPRTVVISSTLKRVDRAVIYFFISSCVHCISNFRKECKGC